MIDDCKEKIDQRLTSCAPNMHEQFGNSVNVSDLYGSQA